jgi:hypothetical protein
MVQQEGFQNARLRFAAKILRSNRDLQPAYAIMGLKPINSVPPLMAAFAQAAADVMADQRD